MAVPYRNPCETARSVPKCARSASLNSAFHAPQGEGLPVERFFRPTDDRIQRTVERASPRSNPGSGLEEGRTHGFDCLRRIGVRFRRVLAVLGQTVEVVTELYLPVPNAEVHTADRLTHPGLDDHGFGLLDDDRIVGVLVGVRAEHHVHARTVLGGLDHPREADLGDRDHDVRAVLAGGLCGLLEECGVFTEAVLPLGERGCHPIDVDVRHPDDPTESPPMSRIRYASYSRSSVSQS